MNGFVYLIGDMSNPNFYKIGVTKGKIENRLKKLQTGNSGELYIVDYYKTNHPFFIEKWMHKKYKEKNIIGEWFQLEIDEVKNFKNNCKKYEEIINILNGNPFFNLK